MLGTSALAAAGFPSNPNAGMLQQLLNPPQLGGGPGFNQNNMLLQQLQAQQQQQQHQYSATMQYVREQQALQRVLLDQLRQATLMESVSHLGGAGPGMGQGLGSGIVSPSLLPSNPQLWRPQPLPPNLGQTTQLPNVLAPPPPTEQQYLEAFNRQNLQEPLPEDSTPSSPTRRRGRGATKTADDESKPKKKSKKEEEV